MNNRKKYIIAIDGTAGSGKSTLAKVFARRLGYLYLDTGSMYRSVTWNIIRNRIALTDKRMIIALAKKTRIQLLKSGSVRVNGINVTKKIRTPEVSAAVSIVSAIKGVRKLMVAKQQAMGKNGGVVLEGRDIGTVVFPNADIKFYLMANPAERAKRRYKELCQKGIKSELEAVKENIIERDALDSRRKVSPLRAAADAIVIDTSGLSIKEKNALAWSYIKRIRMRI